MSELARVINDSNLPPMVDFGEKTKWKERIYRINCLLEHHDSGELEAR